MDCKQQMEPLLNMACDYDLEVCDEVTIAKILCFWTLLTKAYVSETGNVSVFRWNLLSWAQSIELVPIFGPEDGDRIQSLKNFVLNYKQDVVLDENRTMGNVQKHNVYSAHLTSHFAMHQDVTSASVNCI
jgi:hypothetical protein